MCRRGDVLIADMTDPDWEPVMKRAAAIVTRRGGRTCHAAIIARELGVPAVVGCGDSLDNVSDGQEITVSCAEGDTGYVYEGALKFEEREIELDTLPPAPVQIMMNVGNPDRAFGFAGIPNHGVGLARLEFIINRMIGVHPRALLDFERLDADVRARDPRADRRLRRSGHLLRRRTQRRHRPDRRGVRAPTRDRASVRLQVERVRESHRRSPIRAARGEPDARVSRSRALHRSVVPSVLRAGVPRVAIRARGNGAQRTCRSWFRSFARSGRPKRSRPCSRRTVYGAASTACA